MPPKRVRRVDTSSQGLSPGERLKRTKVSGNDYLAWAWVGTEVTNPSEITSEHRLATCGLSDANPYPFCANRYNGTTRAKASSGRSKTKATKAADGELDDDIIVVSEDESPACTSKGCKTNPNCLNYLGQDVWENEDKAQGAFLDAVKLGPDPTLLTKVPGVPVGLKNLGATCYANAFLQVWFQDVPFRAGVYRCRLTSDENTAIEESPIFQLQVTFAAMQIGKEVAFNPVKLVESLKLRTTEQQDAQEFSKLFMAHLDSEFQKQEDVTLKSLIAAQFQGKQVYATECMKCHHRSERETEFLELEVNLANNATLENRVDALLSPEDLNGDNKYLCSQCEELQDAKRYTELRELPPVLHFSLLRFVYDLSTMERKKSKQAIAFPLKLDMSRFLKDTKAGDANVYHLRGVLLHKGTSAYHGHYEAQIFDVRSGNWYQFNDEVVTKITSLGPHPKESQPANSKNTKSGKSQTKPKKANSQKVTKTDSDVEILHDDSSSGTRSSPAEDRGYILSKDAYMLIYVRSPAAGPEGTGSTESPLLNGVVKSDPDAVVESHSPLAEPAPPPRAAEVVETLNVAHEKACEEYNTREKEAEIRFNEIRRRVIDIYQSWSVSDNAQESAMVSRQALESWLSRHLTDNPDSAVTADSMDIDIPVREISVADIVCAHGQLDPTKAGHMKRVTKTAVDRIESEDGCRFVPPLGSSDVCARCVEEMFTEKLYQIEHPRLVTLFDEVSQVAEGERGYWISKPWLKDWRQAKPKMHRPSQQDPSPGEPEYGAHVRCEHGGMTPNVLHRKRISPQAYELLKSIFPTWSALATDAEICATCEAIGHISREDRREAKIQAEEEKAKLKHMYDNALEGSISLLERVPCALVPAHFVRAWKQWLFHPAETHRPDGIDTAQFICEHGLLVLDPNCPSDIDGTALVILRKDWTTLESLYSCGPLLAVENTGNKWTHELAVCRECRLDRKTSFETTELTIRLLRPEEPVPTLESYISRSPPQQRANHAVPVTYGSRVRQSKRIRQARTLGKRRKIVVTRTMRLKDLKILIQEEMGIPTIYQRLYYQGRELEDKDATVGSLHILANDVLDLREESEDIDLLGSGSDRERKSGDGGGFSGTLLSGNGHHSSSPHAPSDREEASQNGTKACLACTFDNPLDEPLCTMCKTPFES